MERTAVFLAHNLWRGEMAAFSWPPGLEPPNFRMQTLGSLHSVPLDGHLVRT